MRENKVQLDHLKEPVKEHLPLNHLRRIYIKHNNPKVIKKIGSKFDSFTQNQGINKFK